MGGFYLFRGGHHSRVSRIWGGSSEPCRILDAVTGCLWCITARVGDFPVRVRKTWPSRADWNQERVWSRLWRSEPGSLGMKFPGNNGKAN